jgi:hypothetical protein
LLLGAYGATTSTVNIKIFESIQHCNIQHKRSHLAKTIGSKHIKDAIDMIEEEEEEEDLEKSGSFSEDEEVDEADEEEGMEDEEDSGTKKIGEAENADDDDEDERMFALDDDQGIVGENEANDEEAPEEIWPLVCNPRLIFTDDKNKTKKTKQNQTNQSKDFTIQ